MLFVVILCWHVCKMIEGRKANSLITLERFVLYVSIFTSSCIYRSTHRTSMTKIRMELYKEDVDRCN